METILQFPARNGYIRPDSLIGRKAGCFTPNRKECFEATEEIMEQVVEQVTENKEEIVELSLAELGEIGGGVGVDCFG